MTVNGSISAQSRSFHSNRFSVRSEQPVPLDGASVLLIDDTWTTGSRVQAASYALKKAGAARVVAVVLGRHADPLGYAPWKPIVQEIQDRRFRLDLCAVHRS